MDPARLIIDAAGIIILSIDFFNKYPSQRKPFFSII